MNATRPPWVFLPKPRRADGYASGAQVSGWLRRCGVGAWLFFALWPIGVAAAETAEPVLPETAVVSAYLMNFLHFIEWPRQAPASSEDPYTICVLGPEDLLDTLKTMAEGQVRSGRKVQAVGVKSLDEMVACHVVYIDTASWAGVKNDFTGKDFDGQLTVGRGRDFLDAGGGISLVVVDQRLRFDVNRDALEGCGLKIDSRLLDAANNVRQARRRGKQR